jgi:predicted RNase H-like nuclease (RuvC/YqgF family)
MNVCHGPTFRRNPKRTSESPVPQPDEMIRSCMDALSKDQEEYAAHMAESLAALEAYEQHLHEWYAELSTQSDQLAAQQRDLEERRKQFVKQQSIDVAMTAELDQARAEIEDLRHRLIEANDTVAASSGATNTKPAVAAATKSGSSVGVMDPAVSAVAKQFHKLRQQQAARRSGSRSAGGQ